MRHRLTLELSEQTFGLIQQQAIAIGVDPEHLITTLIEQNFTNPVNPDGEGLEVSTPTSFTRHFGTLILDHEISLDNESIDADLVSEYINTHEAV